MLFNHRGAVVLVGAASALTLGLGLGSPALASPRYTANHVRTVITGGNATALSVCGNLAKRGKDITQIGECKDVDSTAVGGDVNLQDVDVKVISHTGVKKFNTVDTEISGGDATAVSACIDAAFHSSDVVQQTTCNNVSSTALGGNVSLNNVDITVSS